MSVQALPLEGRFVRLEPFAPELKDEVARALDDDAAAWALMSSNGAGAAFEDWWAAALKEQAKGVRLPYAVRRLQDKRVVGTTSYLQVRPEHRALEIGATFYHAAFRGGTVNPESKLLLLRNAFQAGAVRVEFMIDSRNVRSQAAVKKLGAVQEGVLRKHKTTWTGHVRDTVAFSILDDEWPPIMVRLEDRTYGEL
jgi:RimJ/RimL family protein N-acetyltransferase